MRYAHAIEDIRVAEAALAATLPAGTLMQRAAAGLAATCADLLSGTYGTRVVLLVGSGDNGGDTLYAGARLAHRGAAVTAVLLSPERTHTAGLAALRTAGGRVSAGPSSITMAAVASADLVLDGIIGIGGKGGLRGEAEALVDAVEQSGALIVAVDVPSGIDSGSGEVDGRSVFADVTVTFGTHKPGQLIDPGSTRAGTVTLVDIGLASHLPTAVVEALQSDDVRVRLPSPAATADKYRRGVVGVVAGSPAYTGAAVLAIGGALRGGAGMVRAFSEPGVAAAVRQAWPEAVVTEAADGMNPTDAGQVQAWVIGPGHGTDARARADLEAVLGADVPVVIDADALTLLADDHSALSGRDAPTLLTPHAGELARLLGVDREEVESRRLVHVRRAADTFGVTVLLKGSTTLVVDPGDAGTAVRANATGTPRLATAGSGDVLSGLAGALLAGGLDPRNAGSVAAYLHGLAGRLASDGGPIIARDILDALPTAFALALDAD